MYNKKVIIDAIRNLNKSKPATKYNKAYTNNTTGSKKSDNVISAENGVNAPVFKSLSVGPSKIQGKGIFSQEPIAKDDVIGVSHIRKSFTKNGEQYQAPFPSVELGGYYNHSESPNIYEVDNGDHILMLAKRNINPGEELTSNYYNHNIKDLESPDNFKKGGSAKRPKIPNKKNSKAYSRSLEATNKFFAQNPLFSKPKSRKNKIFDPNAKYYADGGELIKAQNGLSHKERMQAYNDSLALYNSYNQFMNVLKNPQYKIPSAAISKFQGRNQGFGSWALPGNPYQNISPVKVFTHYQGNQPWRVFKYKKPIKPVISQNPPKPCVPKTTIINNVPKKAPSGKKLVGTDEETHPVTGKKCEYVKTINPIYEDIKVEPIELPIIDPPLLENKDLGELQVHDYNLPDSIEAPQYTLDPYTADRLSLDVQLPQNKIAALFDKGVVDSKGHVALGKRNKTRLIPRIVQKATGYDKNYFEGYEDEEGNFVPGELDYGNATGSEMEFRGAASLRDLMNQQKYKKEYEEYDKNLDTWLEQYEQSKKKQAEGRAFKYGGLSKFFDGGENLQEECPPYHYWNGETCVPVDRKLAPLDPQYLLENPDVATNMQIEPEVSVSPLGSDFSKALSWINKWHDSPMHDKMLMKSSKLSTRTDSDAQKLFKEIKDLRKKNIQTIPALDIDFDKTNPNVKLIEDLYGFSPWGISDSNTGNVSIHQSFPGNKQMLVHEISHSSDRPAGELDRLIPYNDQLAMQYRVPLNWKNSQYGKDEMAWYKNSQSKLEDEYMGEEEIPRDIYEQNKFDDWNNYLLSNKGSEVRSRLREIQFGADEQNIYDPFNKKITGRQFKQLDKKLLYSKPLNELRKTYSDKDIKWMLNNISKNDNETDDTIQYSKNGGAKKKDLPKASFGLPGTGKDRSLTFTPFDYRSAYGQASDFNRNPNYSLTYTTPNLFKKADLSANPLSFTLGRPYNTDAQSLTNRTLNFVPQEGLFSSYYDPALGGENNPKYQQYLQDVSNYTGTPVSELNQTIINQYNAAKNLAGAKPLYKKGIPLTANVGWDVFGNAFGDSSSGPFTGYGSLNVGYAPEPGFYGTADLGLMGVFGRRKNNAKISPQRYFDKGLTRQGDMAFIPKLNVLNFALRQRPEYNDIQTQNILNAYANDIEQGTKTAQGVINKTDEPRYDISFLSPEGTVQIKPFKDFPGVASFTGGLRLDYGGKDTMGDNIPITLKPYGNVRYTVPIEGAIDKLKDLNLPAIKRKKTYNDYAYDQDYDEEYTGDTPQEDTPTENNFEVNPPELQVNPNGTILGRGDCPEGYERPCPKCRCQKLKQPAVYTDKRGKHLFDNMSFKDGGSIELTLSKKDIDKYVKGGYIVEDISVPTLTRKEGGWPPKSGSGLIKIAEKVPGLIDKLPTGWEKNIKKFTRSNYNPFSLLAKEIGYDIASQSHRAGRYDTDIINAIKGSEKYPASYFGTGVMHGQTVPEHIRQLYGEGKRDLNRNYFFGDETGFEPTFYDFESDAGLQQAIDWYGPLKAYELFSEIKGGEDLSIKSLLANIPDESKTSGPLVDLMQGYKNDNLLTSDEFKTFYDPTTGKLKLVDASPYSPSEFEGLIKDNLNYLFDQYGQETIPFQVNANTTKEGELPFGFHLRRNPINPYDDIQGHMNFLKRLSKDKFSTVARDLWGFNRKAYMDKYSYEKNLSPWMVDAMDAFGKPMVLTQENPIIFKQYGGAFEYEVGDEIELDDLSKEELERLGYKLEEVK